MRAILSHWIGGKKVNKDSAFVKNAASDDSKSKISSAENASFMELMMKLLGMRKNVNPDNEKASEAETEIAGKKTVSQTSAASSNDTPSKEKGGRSYSSLVQLPKAAVAEINGKISHAAKTEAVDNNSMPAVQFSKKHVSKIHPKENRHPLPAQLSLSPKSAGGTSTKTTQKKQAENGLGALHAAVDELAEEAQKMAVLESMNAADNGVEGISINSSEAIANGKKADAQKGAGSPEHSKAGGTPGEANYKSSKSSNSTPDLKIVADKDNISLQKDDGSETSKSTASATKPTQSPTDKTGTNPEMKQNAHWGKANNLKGLHKKDNILQMNRTAHDRQSRNNIKIQEKSDKIPAKFFTNERSDLSSVNSRPEVKRDFGMNPISDTAKLAPGKMVLDPSSTKMEMDTGTSKQFKEHTGHQIKDVHINDLKTPQFAEAAGQKSFSNHLTQISRRHFGGAQKASQQPSSWKHHRFVLKDGKSIHIAARSSDGSLQLQLNAGGGELGRMLHQHLHEIQQHVQQQMNIEIDLQLQDFGGQEPDQESETASTNRPESDAKTSKGSPVIEANHRAGTHSIRYFGFNRNEWTA